MDQVRFYMEEAVLNVKPSTTVTDAAKYMTENRVGALFVNDDKKCLGIITDVDFTHKVIAKDRDPKTTPVADVFTHPLITLDCEETMLDAFKTMRKNNIRHLGITENKKLVGIISIKDFANYYNYKFGNGNGSSD
ncbi:MAG: hypothetical protein NPINA01_22810 [Nitrospinaceae bacterium]|nr:MAG: hypothetical protein NPINA01_22810 [Nitrospinaceae bacterium]